ncbi:hypothetical protein PROFUN_01904 [Planoprotostelium fungivorum]|uniref:Uncharacterized protein n=1 Tax=Planoprotostelium fungivorum TaxID=1890364 RepID=A0A2P6NYZ8_9EUKA|nr:hypothetical protein PROFUN_01904 [Planoprotostelium fungivorum]
MCLYAQSLPVPSSSLVIWNELTEQDPVNQEQLPPLPSTRAMGAPSYPLPSTSDPIFGMCAHSRSSMVVHCLRRITAKCSVANMSGPNAAAKPKKFWNLFGWTKDSPPIEATSPSKEDAGRKTSEVSRNNKTITAEQRKSINAGKKASNTLSPSSRVSPDVTPGSTIGSTSSISSSSSKGSRKSVMSILPMMNAAAGIEPTSSSPGHGDSIQKAKQTITEIESFIQKELAMMTADDVIVDRLDSPDMSMKKRPGPKLIKPVNKKKNKMVMGNMEYDPVRNVWTGNEQELDVFQKVGGAIPLIRNVGHDKDKPQVVGDMVFDPVEQKWIGNEKDLKKFGLNIQNIQPMEADQAIITDGMMFDPETMKWQGNEESIDIFEGLDDLDSQHSFKVSEGEFNITDLVKSFRDWEEEHKKLGAWLLDGPGDKNDRDHFNDIRGMAVNRIVSQAKKASAAAAVLMIPPPSPPSIPSLHTLSPSASLASPVPVKFSRRSVMRESGLGEVLATSPRGSSSVPSLERKKSIDAEDWDDVDIPSGLKVKTAEDAPDVLIAPSAEATDTPTPTKPDALNQYKDDDDDGFGDVVVDFSRIKTLNRTSSTNSMGSNLSFSSGTMGSVQSIKKDGDAKFDSDDDEDLEDFSTTHSHQKTISISNPRAKQLLPSGTATMSRKLGKFVVTSSELDDAFDKDVEEWTDTDLKLPDNGSFRIKKKNQTPPRTPKAGKGTMATDSEEWSDLDFPSEKPLVIKRTHQSTGSSDEAESEEWSDLEIPRDFALRLNVSQPTNSKKLSNAKKNNVAIK